MKYKANTPSSPVTQNRPKPRDLQLMDRCFVKLSLLTAATVYETPWRALELFSAEKKY